MGKSCAVGVWVFVPDWRSSSVSMMCVIYRMVASRVNVNTTVRIGTEVVTTLGATIIIMDLALCIRERPSLDQVALPLWATWATITIGPTVGKITWLVRLGLESVCALLGWVGVVALMRNVAMVIHALDWVVVIMQMQVLEGVSQDLVEVSRGAIMALRPVVGVDFVDKWYGNNNDLPGTFL